MNFATAIMVCFRKYLTFSGRASRAEFWYWVLFIFLVNLAFGLAGLLSSPFHKLVQVALFLPNLAVSVRRMHDTNHLPSSILLPMVGIAVLYMGCMIAWRVAGSPHEPLLLIAALMALSIPMILAGLALFSMPLIWALRKGDADVNDYGAPPQTDRQITAQPIN